MLNSLQNLKICTICTKSKLDICANSLDFFAKWCIIKPQQKERMNVMNFYEISNYPAEKKLIDEIAKEKKFLTFKKLFKIFELNALLAK